LILTQYRHALLLSRRWLAALVGGMLLVLVTSSGDAAVGGTCTTTTTTTFSVQVCLTQPTPGSIVTGPVTASGTAAVLSGSLRVVRMEFTLDGDHVLTDFQTPYVFTLPTTQWVDGSHSLAVAAVMSDSGSTNSNPASESLTFSNGITVVPPNTNSPTITSGTTPAPGANLVVAAVGDGAGGDLNSTSVANMINTWSPNLFLYLGDVYEKGSYTEFSNWYDGTFGALRSITDPVIGNHEYGTRKAAGFYYYWNNEPNYYSFDAGGWHFIALNSTSQFQSIGWNAQLAWLQSDLAAHAGSCIVAFWHHPLYNIGPEGASTRVQDFWTPLVNARATLVLNGHDHDYQRWQPLDANGNPSAGGLTEIVSGTGGHSAQYFTSSDPRVASSRNGVFGALQLSLSASAAQFKYYTVSGSTSTLFDTGSIPCNGYGTLAGTVTDALTGLPFAGATVSYAGASTVTNSSGAYNLAKAPLGTYQLTAAAGGYSSQSQSVTVNPATTTAQSFSLAPLPGSISGVVSDARTGLPLSGATVSYSGGQAVTDAAGAYSIDPVAEGSYSVSAAANGYADQAQSVSVGPGQSVAQNFALGPAGVGNVVGQVTDAYTGLPVGGATVRHLGEQTTSDSSGMYSLNALPDGDTTLTASSAGYVDQSVTVNVTSGDPTVQDFQLTPKPGSIGGGVTDSVTGLPIAGAAVAYSGAATTTNASGIYTLTGVAEASYTVTTSAAGYGGQSAQVSVGPGAAVVQNFAVVPLPGTVGGTVTDATTGLPLSGVTVSYAGGATSTDSSGQYTFPSVSEGSYGFTASLSGYSSQTQTVSVGPGATVSLNLSLVRRLFSDGFESGTMSAWTTNAGIVVQSTTTHSGGFAGEAISTGAAAYARDGLGGTYSSIYMRGYFLVKTVPSSTVTLYGFRTAGNVSIARLYVDSQGRLALRNDAGAVSTTGPLFSAGSWHSVELHLVVNGGASTIEVWLDGNVVSALTTQTANLGSTPIGQLQMGENQTGRSYDIAFDDVVVQTARVGP
jgi:hypothetical protein